MTRQRLIRSALCIAVPALLAGLTAGPAAADAPRAQLEGFACQHGLDPAQRTIAVQSVMRPVSGTQHMQVRFVLLQRNPGATTPVQVRYGDLGSWRSPPDPTLGQLPGDVWKHYKPVYNLAAPAAYRFRVGFRWIGADGRVLAQTTRGTRWCHERELRPDLLVRSLTVAAIAGHPNQEAYSAVIANQGLTGAGPFQVLFAPGDNSSPTTETIQYLGPGESRRLTFTGPSCNPANPPSVTADSAQQVDDYNRSNNSMTASCSGG